MTKKHPNIEHCDDIVIYLEVTSECIGADQQNNAIIALHNALQHVEQVLRSQYEPVETAPVRSTSTRLDPHVFVPKTLGSITCGFCGGHKSNFVHVPQEAVDRMYDTDHDFVRVYHDDEARLWCLQLRRDEQDTILMEFQVPSLPKKIGYKLANALNIDFVEG